MQNDGYQQAMNEVRILRREREIYRNWITSIGEEFDIRGYVARLFVVTDAIHAEIPTIETMEVQAVPALKRDIYKIEYSDGTTEDVPTPARPA